MWRYLWVTFGMIVYAICHIIVFYLLYTASVRKQVKENQKEWDKIRVQLEEKGADYIEIAEEYRRCMAMWDGCYPCM